jgi:hypothetical protein
VSMARKKHISFGAQLRHAASDVVNAASVAATGSEIGILELAAEDELSPPAVKRPRKRKVAAKKKTAPKKKTARKQKKVVSRKAGKAKKKKRAARRR